jgi:signal transduction histidine kinase
MPSTDRPAERPAGRPVEHPAERPATSLRRRLLLGAALWIAVALLVSGLLIAWLLTRAVESQVHDRLEAEVDRLVAAVAVSPGGTLSVSPRPAEPAFAQPYSGRYWQVAGPDGTPLARSRSLWDGVLTLPEDVLADGQLHRHAGTGPDGAPLVVAERSVVPAGAEMRVRVAVAVNRATVTEVTRPAILTLAASLVLLALGLIVAAWLQVAAGLRPLERLRLAVARITGGQAREVGRNWPAEVAPLARELDEVLASNRRMAEAGRRQAADMAHALKTRLAVAANEAEALRGLEPAAAARLSEELAAARRLLDRHLARARAGGGAPGLRSRVPAAETVGKVTDVVARLSDRALAWTQELDPTAVFLGDRADLEEIAGNLLDNAAKWARTQVRVTLRRADAELVLRVEDDGPGIPPERRGEALAAGVRLDERAPGSGLGLTIAGELAAAYGGSVTLADSGLGGLAAEVRLPAADAEAGRARVDRARVDRA